MRTGAWSCIRSAVTVNGHEEGRMWKWVVRAVLVLFVTVVLLMLLLTVASAFISVPGRILP